MFRFACANNAFTPVWNDRTGIEVRRADIPANVAGAHDAGFGDMTVGVFK